MKRSRILLSSAAIAAVALANSAHACPACFGQQVDAPLAKGLNAGVFTLLGFIGVVLSGASVFFVYLARKSSAATVKAAKPQN